MTFRPMLATDFEETALRFPYNVTPKLDGIRCLMLDGVAKTRTLKLFPNNNVHSYFRAHFSLLDSLDGELIVGAPTGNDVYNRTSSGLMSMSGSPNFTFFVFDRIDPTGKQPFTERAAAAERQIKRAKLQNVIWLPSTTVEHVRGLRAVEDTILDQGYEGVMLRSPDSRYKQGRSTVRENSLLKVKRFRDAEAIVLGVEEQMHNANPAQRNELGRTKRSTAKAGLVGKGTLGALVVKGAPGQPFADVQFSIGTGLNDATRDTLWKVRDSLKGAQVKYRYFDIGVKDAPRHPVFVGLRVEGT